MIIKRPDCIGCSRCCLGITNISEEDYIRLGEYSYKDSNGYFMKRKPFNDMNVCIFLDTDNYQCLHYDDRPITCKEYLPGGVGCINLLINSPDFMTKKINDIWI